MKLLKMGLLFFALTGSCLSAQQANTLIADEKCEAIPLVSSILHIDLQHKTEGSSSLRIDAKAPCRIPVAAFTGIDFDEFTLVTQADVKTDLESGSVVLETLVKAKGSFYFSRALDKPLGGKSDWNKIQTFFHFKKGEKPEEIFINLIVEGCGSVWIDAIELQRKNLQSQVPNNE